MKSRELPMVENLGRVAVIKLQKYGSKPFSKLDFWIGSGKGFYFPSPPYLIVLHKTIRRHVKITKRKMHM
jgi:hypothetical protein